jgi:hypothetical protein
MKNFSQKSTPQTPQVASDNEPLWDTGQTAEYTGEAEGTLRNKRVRGNGPKFVKLGKLVKYRPSDVRAYIAAHVVSCTSEKNSNLKPRRDDAVSL